MSGLRTLLTSGAAVAIVGLGFGIWSAMPQGDDRRKEILKNLPESNPARMEETRQRNVLMLQALKEAAETNDNVARSFPSKSK